MAAKKNKITINHANILLENKIDGKPTIQMVSQIFQ
jgi:hypothetical protein